MARLEHVRWITCGAAVAALAIASCGKRKDLAFRWDDRRVVCSLGIDDRVAPVDWQRIDDAMRDAEATDAVVAFHAHIPGVTVSLDAIRHLLELADSHHLAALTFRDLAADGRHRAGFALAFDDNHPDEWVTVGDLLADHRAHVTFFVTRWPMMSDAGHAEIHELADAGHDIEPHGILHVHAPAYAREHGVDAYVRDEALPSLEVLREAGLPPATTFAYPYGDHTPELDAAMLEHVTLLRSNSAQCPPRIPW